MDETSTEEGSGGSRRCGTALFCSRTSLLLLMTGYALLGALLFKSLEGGDGGGVPVNVQRSREDCLRELWLITERLNVLYEKNWTRLVTEQLKRFERAVAESGPENGGVVRPISPQWSFGGALLYSLTLLTTVGYGRLSPRTALGKIVAIIYAIIGVPLMLILLSALGTTLASGARKTYQKLCCVHERKSKNSRSPSVGYQKAPTSPHYCKAHHEETASIQLGTPIHNNCKFLDHQEVPKRAILATVRATHTRGRCRQGPVRQMLADPPMCPAHSHGTPVKNSYISGGCSDEDTEDQEESDHIMCSQDTPSRIPLIWRPPEAPPNGTPPIPHYHHPPSVPITIVVLFFIAYVAMGAVAFATTSDWSFLDATYFCFIALSTIGVGDKLPQSTDAHAQMQIFACCVYLFLGLVVVAMCFSLVHEDLAGRCKQIANNMGLLRQ